ncbi:TetR family transcriptional regulator [Ferrovibrio terrae]|uniref:TetR family transcriptional regulator n=1 Tax=Ferrovibrio terrae TaxID=2594003 RepID=A0A516H3F3_9PROT|nr:TetR/AcrR family transcriptional regulator [Ferrovibrio terrae]QDO98120.1 TetR family transcriptional regulator [Ferrovibrio terrae]
MAKTTGKATRKAAAAKTGAAAERVAADPVAVMLDLVAEQGWRAVTLGRIAQASGLPLSALYGQYASKTDLLTAYARRIDLAMLAALGEPGPAPADAAAVKDRLFEAVMARFDALNPHKAAIRVMMRELPGDPVALACFLHRGLRQGLDWMLAAAELDAGGLSGAVRRKLLGGIYLDTLRVWLKDDGADMATTMAHLDKRLEQGLGLLTGRGPLSRLREKATTST